MIGDQSMLERPAKRKRRRALGAARQARRREREAMGIALYLIEGREHAIARAMVRAMLLSEGDALDRELVARALGRVIDAWAEEILRDA